MAKRTEKPTDLTTRVLVEIRDTLRSMNGRLGSMDERLGSMDERLSHVEREIIGLRQDFSQGDALIRRLVDARFELVNRRLDALEQRRGD